MLDNIRFASQLVFVVTLPSASLSDLTASLDRFTALLDAAWHAGTLDRIVLANPGNAAEAGLQRVIARPVALRGQTQLSLVYRYQTKDITKNLPWPEALAALRGLGDGDVDVSHDRTLSAVYCFSASRASFFVRYPIRFVYGPPDNTMYQRSIRSSVVP